MGDCPEIQTGAGEIDTLRGRLTADERVLSQRHLGVFPRPESMDPQPSPPAAVRRGRGAGRLGTVERKPGSGRTGGGREPLPADVPGCAPHRPGERVGASPHPLSRICPGPIPGRLPRGVGRERRGRGRPRADPGAVAPPAAVDPAEPLVGRRERLRRPGMDRGRSDRRG